MDKASIRDNKAKLHNVFAAAMDVICLAGKDPTAGVVAGHLPSLSDKPQVVRDAGKVIAEIGNKIAEG